MRGGAAGCSIRVRFLVKLAYDGQPRAEGRDAVDPIGDKVAKRHHVLMGSIILRHSGQDPACIERRADPEVGVQEQERISGKAAYFDISARP
jgi:hypothetical protein